MRRGLLKEGQTGAGAGPGRGTERKKLRRIPYTTAFPNPKKESQEAPQSQKILKSLRLEKP